VCPRFLQSPLAFAPPADLFSSAGIGTLVVSPAGMAFREYKVTGLSGGLYPSDTDEYERGGAKDGDLAGDWWGEDCISLFSYTPSLERAIDSQD